MSDDSKVKIAVPGEWAIEKTLGPTLDVIGVDLAKLYSSTKTGVAKIALATKNKIKSDDSSNKQTNLRVTRDVFWNGAYSDEDICAEYFGGVLAGSRSTDGKNDTGIFYLDLVKSLSSTQLKLHFFIYSSLNKILAADISYKSINVAQSQDINSRVVYLDSNELLQFGINLEVDLVALHDKNLIESFEYNGDMHPDKHHLTKVVPTTLGVQLFAVAANMLPDYRKFNTTVFDNFNFSEKLPKAALSPEGVIPVKAIAQS